jgi:hypothetical protein
MTLDLLGDIVLDSQGDQVLIIVTNPGASNQSALRLPLSYRTSSGLTPVETDDTAFVTSSEGFILFAPGAAYTAADGGPLVGTLDMTSGIITPVVTGLGNPGGLVFVDTRDQAKNIRFIRQSREEDEGKCDTGSR